MVIKFEAGGWKDDGHTNRIHSVKFAKFDPKVLVSGGWDNCIHFWDLR